MSELKSYIDDTLSSDYELVKELSKTAVNELLLYRHKKNDKKLVVIKSYNRNDDVFRTLKSIDSKGYLPFIYEVSSEEDYLLVLEEYIDGTSLVEILNTSQHIQADKVKSYLIDLCISLEILHRNGIVHRDIKPENIIIRNDKACLIDLSIAKMMNDKNNDTINLGTIGYAAPEQFGISQSKPATDIYALGVLANEMLTGVHPTIEIPKGKLGRIIDKCTSTQISKRYQSVVDLRRELSKI